MPAPSGAANYVGIAIGSAIGHDPNGVPKICANVIPPKTVARALPRCCGELIATATPAAIGMYMATPSATRILIDASIGILGDNADAIAPDRKCSYLRPKPSAVRSCR